ncbi:cell envelope integrity protein CreD [Emticicia aquatilis]|uniref:Cell envelope integrity protein CreD n=2 Tax=Emticicia aquatilis TaxID=1537369 RepID=A0A916YG21_9BACT|nr:cell envelope integrity protein CreD [Emticicia aquatilis]
MIQSLISEREGRKSEVIQEVSSKWGNSQQLIGPILRIPYYEISRVEKLNTNGKKEIEQTKSLEYAYFLPNKLVVNGLVSPEKRSRGIYEIVVYNSKTIFDGDFENISLEQFKVLPENILWKDASVLFTLSDFRGITDDIELTWNGNKSFYSSGAKLPFSRESNIAISGISTPVNINNEGKGKYVFHFEANLKGSESLNIVPIGKTTKVMLNSNWQNPSFIGAFLPDKRVVNEKGFAASWKVLHLNRDFPQQWTGITPETLTQSSFGVNLITPNDNYQQSSRSVKYAILIIALIFMAFFFIEILNKKRVHPFNYILIGLALCIFYTLLLSISEFLTFNISYLIATFLTVGLVFLYSKSIFQNTRLSGLVALVMLTLYGFIFVIIQLEDTALLIGSIGLFTILSITMYISRRIDWQNVGLKSN